MIDEHLKGPLKVLLVQNQQPVETFCASCAHEPFGHPVGVSRQQLVRDVGLTRAGLVMGLEVSRLARNSTDCTGS